MKRLAALLLLSGCVSAPQPATELVVVNARKPGSPTPVGVLVRGNRIAAVGPSAEVLAQAAPGTKQVDAGGGLLLPGFHDSHNHLLDGGLALGRLDISGIKDIEAAIRAIREYADAHPALEWIEGRGWEYELAPGGRYPTRLDLDRAVRDRPVVLESYDGHSWWGNSRAFSLAGVGPDTPDPSGGRIIREADGRTPQGVLLEEAGDLLTTMPPPLTEYEKLDALEAGLKKLVSVGVTSVDDMAPSVDEELDLLSKLEARGRLPIRVFVSPPIEGEMDRYARLSELHRGPKLWFGYVKGFVDGAIETRTGALLDPYPGSADKGEPRYTQESLNEVVAQAQSRGLRVALHAVGDRAVQMALNAYEAVGRPPKGHHRVEHAEVVSRYDIPRFKELEVVASMQPLHADPEGPEPNTGPWASNLDPERLARSWPWRSLLENGAVLAFGSDWPVVEADPLPGIAVAMTRKDRLGRPSGGWHGEQAITAGDAILAYTFGPAYALGLEDQFGTLEAGKLADLVVLEPSVDLEKPETLWKENAVRYVVADGVLAFEKK